MKNPRSWVPVIVLTVIALGCCSAVADPKKGLNSKINPALMALHGEHTAHAARQSALPFVSRDSWVGVRGDRVVIDAVADGDPVALKAALSALGMQHIALFGRMISGHLPISAIPALNAIGTLRFAQPAYSIRRVGSTTSQGDEAMRADIARGTLGVSGAGVQVGVISDSFNCKGGAQADVTSGDLPAVQVIQEDPGCGSGTDEGRAMLQIVHDVAPAASLAFATSEGGQASVANNILALRANGANVLVDDVIYLAEPMFQDGIIAQAVDTVVRQGAAYFSAAGNEARLSYESVFRPGTVFMNGAIPSAPGAPHFFGGTAHNFASSGPEDNCQNITIPAQSSFAPDLQWDSPFFSVSGGAGSLNDLDVYLMDAACTQVLDGSTATNTGRDPLEFFRFTNNSPTPRTLGLMIVNFDGPFPGYLKYINFGGSDVTVEFNTASATAFGHPNAAGAQAVGAAFFAETPTFRVNPPLLEPFSSGGGVPIFFDTLGNRLAIPVIRRKPEITAPDGGNTTFFGQFLNLPGVDTDTFRNFFGTSAAAPHAAGVAALLLEKQPILTPTATYAALQATAIDMGSAGFDFDSGYGLIQADSAVTLVTTQFPSAGAILPASRAVQVGHTATAFAAVINAGASVAKQVSIGLATNVPGTFSYQTADPSNVLTGAPDNPVDIPPGGIQNFVIAFTPSAPFGPTDVRFNMVGANLLPVTPIPSVNTLLIVSTAGPGPDVVALAATVNPSLIVDIPRNNGAAAFAVATFNVGAAGNIQVSTDKGSLPISVAVCQTTGNGSCLSAPTSTVTVGIGSGGTPTFSFFVQGQGNVPFDPANNRIFAVFTDTATGNVVGKTSTAVRTTP
jgi:hypothetical protein